MPHDKLLTVDEVAQYLRLDRYTVYRMAERGELPGAKIARRWRFGEADLRAWFERQKSAWSSPRRQPPSSRRQQAKT